MTPSSPATPPPHGTGCCAGRRGSIDVIVQRGAGRALAGIRAHRTRSLDPFDVWRRDSILVTSPARTALDLAAEMTPKALRRMVRQAFADGILSVRQLHDVLAASPRHPGAARLAPLLADGHVPDPQRARGSRAGPARRRRHRAPEVNPRLVLDGRTIQPGPPLARRARRRRARRRRVARRPARARGRRRAPGDARGARLPRAADHLAPARRPPAPDASPASERR